MNEIDVVIPAHNAEPFLAEAVRSALRQTLAPKRVIVVDDGSTDRTAEVAASFGERVILVRHERCRGLPAARNSGIRAGDAPLVALLDADDAWLERHLERAAAEFARHPHIGLCYAQVVDCDENLRPISTRKFRRREAEDVFDELYMSAFPIPPSAAVLRREALERCGMFDERLLKAQDFECWLRIAMLYPISCIDEPLCLRRNHARSITQGSDPERVLHYDALCFKACEEAAARLGRRLPIPAERRIVIGRRRRMREALAGGDLEAARVFRETLRREGALRAADRVRFAAGAALVLARRAVRRFR
ncbi:MAG: glycosyltransferase family 2 protein [Acidobacteria bacterium]|nr:MAG: glycosyltransferase family 2 protein [Acidobacteriota bacterium]